MSERIAQCIRDGTPIEYDPWGNTIMVMDGPHRGRGIDVNAMLAAYRTEAQRLNEARLYGEKMCRDRHENIRRCGADLLQIIRGPRSAACGPRSKRK